MDLECAHAMGRCLVLGCPAGRGGGEERADRAPLMPCHAMPFLKLLRWYVHQTYLPVPAMPPYLVVPACPPACFALRACVPACVPACLPSTVGRMQFMAPHMAEVRPSSCYAPGGLPLGELGAWSTAAAAAAPIQNRGSTPAFCTKWVMPNTPASLPHYPLPPAPCPLLFAPLALPPA